MTANNNSKVVSVRKAVLDALLEINEQNRFCDKVVHFILDKLELDKRDRKFFLRLTEGTVERLIELDYIINQFSKVKVKKMKPVIREIIRMGVYQILYMDQVPDSAACNEAVKLAKRRNLYKLSGFVNGVLRNIARNKENIVYPDKTNIVKYLSVKYSMPEWIVEVMIERYDSDVSEKMFQNFLSDKGVTSVRLTLSKYTKEQIEEVLQMDNVTVEDGKMFDFAKRISGYSSLTELRAFREGMFQVQDESSMIVGNVAGIERGDTVIDICAAPGGKTLHVADLLAENGKVYSCDLTSKKVDLIKENVERLGYSNIETFVNDALVFRDEWIDKADVVIADLPCSGLGVIGKKCDIKYKTAREDIFSLTKVQRKILTNVAKYVKNGGTLVYSTCTIAREENEDNVKWILENLPFESVSIENKLPSVLRGKTGEKGYIQVLPTDAGTDGFFVAIFRKVKV